MISSEDMISSEEIQGNLYGLYEDMAASGLVSSGTAGGCRYIQYAGSAWPNMVYPGGSGARPDIAMLVESVKARQCPRLVLFEEAMVTTELVEEMNGFRFVPAAQWINMTLPLSESAGGYDRGQLECKVVDAGNPAEWKDWSSVAEEVLFKKEKLGADLFKYGCESGLFKLITGYSGDQAVSTTLLYRGRQAGVYMVATLAAFQGKGLGKELMGFTGSVAAAEGYSALVLHSTKAGLRLYESLGYRSKGKLLLYYCMA
ncbi:MAG TPA: GNAT family N-acetyltransferase [Puia sp.]|jgi:GNAT superfamily N-acetyltransferase|nr:GNAT family N-acetyltransferase [Puia sp.]